MGRSPARLKCPSCSFVGQYEMVGERDPVTLTRTYRCLNCEHTYRTVEAIHTAEPDALILVPHKPQPSAFDPTFIEDHLENHLRKLLTSQERSSVVDEVRATFPRHMVRLEQVPRAELEGVVGPDRVHLPVFHAAQIRQVVQEVLVSHARKEADPEQRRRREAAAATYRLTQVDTTIADFADWLDRTFSLTTGSSPRQRRARDEELWIPPEGSPTRPVVVVKNRVEDQWHGEVALVADEDRAATRRRREHATFQEGQLRRALERALGNDEHDSGLSNRNLARMLLEFILWSCDGQYVVRSSQLAAYAAGALRRAVPVAYLRWTAIGKELYVRELREEARLLLEHPSPVLRFRRTLGGLPSPT